MQITQNAYNVTKQRSRNLRVKINLLDFNYQIVDEISGDVISGNVSVDANSDIRRTCTISLSVTNNSYKIQTGGKIWLNRYIQIYVGIENIKNGKIEWINQGIYLIDAPSWVYSATEKTLSFNGLDLMCKMTGIRNGNLEGIPTTIPIGTNIYSAVVSTITQLGGFSKYIIEDTLKVLPYEIKIDSSGTVYDILSQLRDVYPMRQIYFDLDGVFHFESIPMGNDDPELIDDDIWECNVLSENVSVDFSSVKNTCEVIGKSIEPVYFSKNVTYESGIIKLSIPGYTSSKIDENTIFGFYTDYNYFETGGLRIQVNNSEILELRTEAFRNDEPIGERIVTLPDKGYLIIFSRMWQAGDKYFEYWGNQTPKYVATDVDTNSPFNINTIGKIRKVFSGGEYENIYTNSQAKERAQWELYTHTNMNNSLNLSCVPIYWLDVNIVGQYTTRFDNIKSKYIIKSINTDLSETGTQTINMIKYYPFYPNK